MVAARYAVLETALSADLSLDGEVVPRQIRVGDQGTHVILFVDKKPVPMRTVQAVELMMDLARRAEELTQMRYAGLIGHNAGVVVLKCGGERIGLPTEFARRLAGALGRRADKVDDFQIKGELE